ncbi:MAG: tetratricopeptide repeat protein, partial [Bacteroidales bacterium]
DEIFLRCGVASCENLISLYTSRFDENKDNVEFLEKLVNILSANQCNTNNLYFEASEALFKAKPSAQAAMGLAQTFKQQGEYTKAQEYYKIAIEAESDNALKSKYYVDLGNMLNRDLSNPKEARIYAKKALEFVPTNGYAYFLLGEIYSNEKNCGNNDFEKRSVYWVVVDCYEKAKQVDASLAENSNKYIAAYKQYFPSKEDIFFHNLERGKSYTINCWIDEKTTIRPRE